MEVTQATWGLTESPTGTQRSREHRFVVVHPLAGVFRLDEGEAQGTDPLLRGEQDGVPPAAGHPQGGCGLCTGLGTTLRGGIVTKRPSTPPKGVSVMQRMATSSPSSQASRLVAGSMPKPPSSASDEDSPPELDPAVGDRSSMAIRSAIRAGWL